MRRFSYLVAAALMIPFLCVSTAAFAERIGGVVQTQHGPARGEVVEGFNVLSWKGIPYAVPPVGERRWQAPGDLVRWPGVLDASAYGNRCFQPSGGDEDCLYLNVWRPDTDQKNLPVFFYIHGGSNTGGSGEGSWYTVAKAYNVVVVTINYRLGVMGWFSHPALTSGNPLDDSGNFGTLDQIKALEWVRANIERFGGDARNVTIAGASAGAQNVAYLMHSRLAKDLFDKAIMESNFPGIRPVAAAFKSSKQVLYNLLVADGTAADSVAAKARVDAEMTDAEIADYFRHKTAKEITDVYATSYWGSINWGDFYRDDIASGSDAIPPPIVQGAEDRPEFVYAIGDGYVLPYGLDFADFSDGNVYPKPVVVGTTKNENNAWNAYWPFNFQEGKTLDKLVAEAIDNTNPDYAYLAKFYSEFAATPDEFKANYKFATGLIDEVDTYLGAHLPARNLVRVNAARKNPVYVYRFDWGSDPRKDYGIPYPNAWTLYAGALHVAEMDFFYQKFFGLAEDDSIDAYQYNDANLPGRQKLSRAAGAYLYEFLRNKNGKITPNRGQPVRWEPWTKQDERFIVFDADKTSLDVGMNDTDIARTPEALYDAHKAHRNPAVRDFIEYYIMWSWHWNWYPNAGVEPFDTSPGPNAVFDPSSP